MIKKTQPRAAIYFIGIGGIGLSALARYFKFHDYIVAGSDSTRSFITGSLLKEGIKVKIGQVAADPALRQSQLVVYSRAIPLDHPELLAAKKIGIPTIPYAKVLGELTKQYRTIAITGSHGKSTTTALAALTLLKGGLDPTVLIGTNLREFGGKNIRIGKERLDKPNYLILEADDFGAAFLEYSPSVLIVTNIDREHMDFYKTFAGVKNAFLKCMATIQDGGTLILNRDDKILFSLKDKIEAIQNKKKLKLMKILWYSTKDSPLKKVIKLSGEHNLSNATAVAKLGKLLNIPKEKVFSAIGAYRGSWRRLDHRGIASIDGAKAIVYDDYAHHPTEIRATLQAFREKFPNQPIVCVFQPHQAKRLQMLFKEFIDAFNDADILVLVPFYKVAGRDEKETNITSERLAGAIAKKYPRKQIYYLENPTHIKKILNKVMPIGRLKPVIIMMGAGDIVNYTDLLLR